MAQNDFLTFATGAGANVQDQATWYANPTRSTGFVGGLAKSIEANKAIRQGAFVASSVSEWVNEQLVTIPIYDDGNVSEWVANFDAAIVHRINSIVGSSVSGYLPLSGGTLYRGGASLILNINADTGQYSGIIFNAAGRHSYRIDVNPSGNFELVDHSTGVAGLWIDTGSNVGIPNAVTIGGFASLNNGMTVQGGANFMSAVNLLVGGVTTALYIPSAGGNAVINVANGGITTSGTSCFGGQGINYGSYNSTFGNHNFAFGWDNVGLHAIVDGADQGPVSLGSVHGQASFFSPGSFSWTCPNYVNMVFIRCWGAGGGGSGSTAPGSADSDPSHHGSSGGGGGYSEGWMYVTPGGVYGGYVGAGGGNAANGAAAGNGQDSGFGPCTAHGGTGGSSGPGLGGGSSGGSFGVQGQAGTDLDGINAMAMGGAAGGGGGLGGIMNASGSFHDATQPGGGGGANDYQNWGTSGAAGGVVLWW